jgi:acetyl esterase/lipase
MKHEIVKEPLDAEIAAMLQRWKDSGIPDLYEGGDASACRERGRNVRALFYPWPKLPKGRIEALTIAGDGVEVPIRIVWPHEGPAVGTLVYFHGGGWILGDLDSHEMHAVRLANRCGVAVVNVGYRLVPEHRFPAAIDDAMAALRWAAAHLARLGGEGAPLAVGGDSAGGNLAAASAWMARDEGIKLKAQLLLYPATNLGGERRDGPGANYLGPNFESAKRDPRASPLLANLAGVAPAILGVGPHDFLFEDNLAYVEALEAAGVEVTLRLFPSLNHGFFSYTAISKASEAAANRLCDDLADVMRR